MKILVTGGTGYIGSHTIVDLLSKGYYVISLDNLSNSNASVLQNIKAITQKDFEHFTIDITNQNDLESLFQQHPDIKGIIHFAAYKAVGESVEQPLKYYHNNVTGLINLLQLVQAYNVPYFVFSSSCTVYGNPDIMPVTEQTPLQTAASPYGHTKAMAEQIIKDLSKVSNTKFSILRYFNPAGAHPSNLIGELPVGKPKNLVPSITQFAIGKLPSLHVFGTDYNTRDGSCLRDYIHVCDLAEAHFLALKHLTQTLDSLEIFNLGSGSGITVLEAIKAFEEVSGIQLNYTLSERRAGDVEAIYANNNLAKEVLDWQPKYSLKDIMKSAWAWEQKINE
jgi:UDP-glucose 4-epimerase